MNGDLFRPLRWTLRKEMGFIVLRVGCRSAGWDIWEEKWFSELDLRRARIEQVIAAERERLLKKIGAFARVAVVCAAHTKLQRKAT